MLWMICKPEEIQTPVKTPDPDFPVVQYVDDTLLIMPADEQQTRALKNLLEFFNNHMPQN